MGYFAPPDGVLHPLEREKVSCMIKLIVTDMDGTFLDENSQYDRRRLKELLARLKEKEIQFVTASGRSVLSLQTAFSGFEEDIIFIGENGGQIVYRGQTIAEKTMPKDVYLTTVDKMLHGPFYNDSKVHLSGKKAAYVLSSVDPNYLAFIKHYYPLVELVDDFSQIDDEIYKVGANFEARELQKASQWLTDTISGIVSVTSNEESLDVLLEDIDKGFGLRQLCEKLDISADQVIAFGDNFNDVQMLEFAGRAVVPENAHEDIQTLADEVIAHHATGSVIQYMEEIACQSN